MAASKEEWIELMTKVFKEVHDEFTAIRLANQFYDDLITDVFESQCKTELLERFMKNYGEKLGINEIEIKRQQVSLTRLIRERGLEVWK